MAIRRYVFAGLLGVEGAQVTNFEASWVEVSYNDEIFSEQSLDQLMAQKGFMWDDDAGLKGMRLKSPNGSTFSIRVDDNGVLSTVPA